MKYGHEITVIRYSKDIDKKIERKVVDGINIITVKINYSQSKGVIGRLKAFVHFMLIASYIALKEKHIDLVIATSTPLTIGFPALVLKKFRGIPYVFEVRDLWPEVPIQMGGLKNKMGIKLALWFEKSIYKNASHIIALSPGMKEGVVKTGIPENKVAMIPNMAKIDRFWEREPDAGLMKSLDIHPKTFKIIYFGAMGEANAIEYILEAAGLLKKYPDIELIFIGNGSKESLIVDSIEKQQLHNVRFLGLFNMERTSEIVNFCDVSLVTFSNIPILATNSPNKLFDSLSAGKPIIVNSDGWTRKMVEDNACGVFVDPESPEDLVEKIVQMKNSPEWVKKMGANARKLAETEFDKSILCNQFVEVIHALSIGQA